MSAPNSAAPRLQVVTDVTGWSPGLVDRLFDAIQSVQTEAATPIEDSETTGWTKELVEKAIDLLTGSRATVQIRVIRKAIADGGSIGREDVYVAGGFPDTRSLKGFTRPVNRATSALRDSGELPEDAEEFLEPIYDMSVTGYQRAQGFRIPLEIVKLYSR